jgi:hypothetical protein
VAILAVLAGGTAGALMLRTQSTPAAVTPAAVLAPAISPAQVSTTASPVVVAKPTPMTAGPRPATSHWGATTVRKTTSAKKTPATTAPKALPAKQPSSASDRSYRCTNQLDYSSDPRDNATINSIGAETGQCPAPIRG